MLTIGNFDGVHRGASGTAALREEGRQRGLPVVMIFSNPSCWIFAVDKAPARLTRLREKGYLAESVDYVLCVRFDLPVRRANRADFISELLVRRQCAVPCRRHRQRWSPGDFCYCKRPE